MPSATAAPDEAAGELEAVAEPVEPEPEAVVEAAAEPLELAADDVAEADALEEELTLASEALRSPQVTDWQPA